jgi:hypothetical protein
MKRKLWLLALVGAILLSVSPVLADGDFYVVAGGGGGGTSITSLPYTISKAGFYYLKGNLTTSTDGITINANEVTLDLMGFSLTGPGTNSGNGIYINDNMNNVEVRNGSVKNFFQGINSQFSGKNHRLANLKASGCTTGIRGCASGIIISGCEASGNSVGFLSDAPGVLIDKNTATSNTLKGFSFPEATGTIINNAASANGTGFHLGANPLQLVDRNASVENTTNWNGLDGCTKGLNTPDP